MKYFIILLQLLVLSSCKSQSNQDPEVNAMLKNIKANFVFVAGGTFVMGNPEVGGATRIHEVTLDSYSINKYETTFEEFDSYTIETKTDSIYAEFRQNPTNGPKYGAKGMDWQEGRNYCQWLGKQLDLPIDLPTEAQWEYAARSRGMDVAHATNSGLIEGGDKDNYGDGEVGSFPPNPIGIYDMSGGRGEWTLDWYAAYPKEPQINPMRDSIEIYEKKVVRGMHSLVNSVYKRRLDEPTRNGAGVGIRCVCNQKTPVN